MNDKQEIIALSKKRCEAFGLRNDIIPEIVPTVSEAELGQRKQIYKPFITVMKEFGQKTIRDLNGLPVVILLSDDDGVILESFGDETLTSELIQIGIKVAVRINEREMGTNAISLALMHGAAIELVGGDHYHLPLSGAVCYCVPFRLSRELGNLAGTIAMMTTVDNHSPYALALLSNMTEAISREIALHKRNRHQYLLNHLIIHSVNSGIVLTDRGGVIVEFNEVAGRVSGVDREGIIGRPIEDIPEFAQFVLPSLKEEQSIDGLEYTFESFDAKTTVCLLDSVPIRDEQGHVAGAYLQVRDITERVELERTMMTYEKLSAVGKLAAGMAHEIRNPLTTIMGFNQILLERSDLQEIVRRYISISHAELQDLNRLVSDFVLMAKPSPPQMNHLNLTRLIEDTVMFMEAQAKLNNIVIHVMGSEPVHAVADAGQIKQVLINLLQNAMEAMPGGGSIHISLSASSQCAVLIVRDEGHGMTESQARDVFTPFVTSKETGVGLGLSICYRIIEAHGGTISLDTVPNKGTAFRIELPAPMTTRSVAMAKV
ncbi:ATP-binding protein [Paenibacillus sp. LHD-117]|uniref:ATP-binding protein n=1 Tax=Paenibacillus sp. LHD-117 TaxID=3071412 RepID=UPI0027DF4973|nr:ATP-binding protein [Paenibacillus sp. LHD-117]MDQ6423504.1 ATP-binding protein [Paenibacillus sp. LHD-117]